MKMKQREYTVDSISGRVYYIEKGHFGLLTVKNIELYEEMIAEEKKLATTYFEFHTDSIGYCKIQLVNHKAIMKLFEDIANIEQRTTVMLRYFKVKEEMGI